MNEITDQRKAEIVRAQLAKICASTRFVNSHRLTQFLRLVVEESLAGRGDQIKEYSIGVEVYNRPSGYDPRVDATVRVEASKLRKRLSEYYSGEGQGDAILITIPKGHYAPVFEYAAPENTRRRSVFTWPLILSAVAVVVVSMGTWWINSSRRPFRLGAQRLISTFPGSHTSASFSPDGAMIAFLASTGHGAAQVWVKNLSHGDPLQITDGETDASRPRWSPQNDQIVFARQGQGIWSVPPLGGAAQRIIAEGRNPDFSPDGRQVVFEKRREIWVARFDGSGQHHLLGLPQGSVGLGAPAFSPDGRSIALVCRTVGPKGDIWVLPAAGGQARRVTFDEAEAGDPAWTPDGRWIVFPSDRAGASTLWQVAAAGGQPEPLTIGVGEDTSPAISPDGKTLVFTNARNSWSLTLLDVTSGAQKELLTQRQNISMPTFSPDGERLAFFQKIEGDEHLFVIGADGAGLRQVTRDRGQQNIMPSWSSDGNSLYFYQVRPTRSFRRQAVSEAVSVEVARWTWGRQNFARMNEGEQYAVYTLSDGIRPKATLVRDLKTGQEIPLAQPIARPQWSRDGRIILGSTADDRIMACPVSGSDCKVLTNGNRPKWSVDNSKIYFFRTTNRPDWFELWSADSEGSRERRIAAVGPFSAAEAHFDVSSRGQVAWVPISEGRQELWLSEIH
jgi:Tol biopolymer transport system component